MTWTTDTLVSRVRRRANIPDASAGGMTDQEILDIAYEELLTIFDYMIKVSEGNYNVTSENITLVASQQAYRIPRDALGGAIRDVRILDSSGNTYILPEVNADRAPDYQPDGTVCAFAMDGGYIRLLPAPNSVGSYPTIQVRYFRRPSKLVPVSECFDITSTTSTTIVVSSAPGYGSTTEFDVVFASPQFDVVLDGVTGSWSTTTVTFSGGEDTSELSVGDYVCAHMETCVPGIPDFMHAALVSATAMQVLNEEGDFMGSERERGQRDRALASSKGLLAPRANGTPNFIVNRGSPLRRGASWGRRLV